jgi:hypothetical protein
MTYKIITLAPGGLGAVFRQSASHPEARRVRLLPRPHGSAEGPLHRRQDKVRAAVRTPLQSG